MVEVARNFLQRLRADGAWLLKPVLIGIVGAWLALSAFGHQTSTMGPFHIRFDASFGRGITDISLQQLAQESQTTIDDVLEHFAALHEIGSLQWDSDLKTHVMTVPDDSTGADAASPTPPAAL